MEDYSFYCIKHLQSRDIVKVFVGKKLLTHYINSMFEDVKHEEFSLEKHYIIDLNF